MNKRDLVRMINRVADRVNEHIKRQTDQSNKYSRGLAREGFLGGYLQALRDVDLASRDVKPGPTGWAAQFWADEEIG